MGEFEIPAWVNALVGGYAAWRAIQLRREGAGPWTWGSMAAVGGLMLLLMIPKVFHG